MHDDTNAKSVYSPRKMLNSLVKQYRRTLAEPVQPDTFLRSIAGRWPSHRFLGNSTQAVYARQVRFLSLLLGQYLRRQANSISILDWGCGKGHISHLLRTQDFQVTSTDIESASEDSAFGQETPILQEKSIHVAPLRHPVMLPFESSSFDCVTSFGVLEHVPEDLPSLQEIRRVLKPGGVLYVTFLPYRFSWTQCVARLLGDNYHDRLYTRSRVLELASRSGFSVQALWWAQIFPKNVVPYSFDRLLEPLDRFICRTPLKHLATNLEIVMVAE